MSSETLTSIDRLVTGEELLAMANIGRCELVRGRIAQMSPTGDRHGAVEYNFGKAIGAYVDAHASGKVRVGEVGVFTHRDPDTVRGADVAYISAERYASQKGPGFLTVAPDLIVEVLSPNDAWSEVMKKLHEYFSAGVRLVWVADPESCTVYAYRSPVEVREFRSEDNLSGDDLLPGFAVSVADLFRE